MQPTVGWGRIHSADDIAVDGAGSVYVADSGGTEIQKIRQRAVGQQPRRQRNHRALQLGHGTRHNLAQVR
jgi:hypothetical protein